MVSVRAWLTMTALALGVAACAAPKGRPVPVEKNYRVLTQAALARHQLSPQLDYSKPTDDVMAALATAFGVDQAKLTDLNRAANGEWLYTEVVGRGENPVVVLPDGEARVIVKEVPAAAEPCAAPEVRVLTPEELDAKCREAEYVPKKECVEPKPDLLAYTLKVLEGQKDLTTITAKHRPVDQKATVLAIDAHRRTADGREVIPFNDTTRMEVVDDAGKTVTGITVKIDKAGERFHYVTITVQPNEFDAGPTGTRTVYLRVTTMVDDQPFEASYPISVTGRKTGKKKGATVVTTEPKIKTPESKPEKVKVETPVVQPKAKVNLDALIKTTGEAGKAAGEK